MWCPEVSEVMYLCCSTDLYFVVLRVILKIQMVSGSCVLFKPKNVHSIVISCVYLTVLLVRFNTRNAFL